MIRSGSVASPTSQRGPARRAAVNNGVCSAEPRRRGTDTSHDRLDALVAELNGHRATLTLPRNLGTALRPRRCSDPCVDDAAWAVCTALLDGLGRELGQIELLRRYAGRVAIDAKGRRCGTHNTAPVAWAHEWDACRVINDRIWQWLCEQAVASCDVTPPPLDLDWLERGIEGNESAFGVEGSPSQQQAVLTMDLYHRCDEACLDRRQVLVDRKPRGGAGPWGRLTVCGRSCRPHLCRADARSCTALRETSGTELVCIESGAVSQADGVAMVWGDADPDWARQQRAIEYDLGNRAPAMRATEAICRQRAFAIATMQHLGCPQIVAWDPATGLLQLQPDAPVQHGREVHFDPTFLWAATPDADANTSIAPDPSGPPKVVGWQQIAPLPEWDPLSVSDPPPPASASFSAKPGRKRALARSLPFVVTSSSSASSTSNPTSVAASQKAKRPAPHPRQLGPADHEYHIVARVLDELLWDPEARRNNNAAQAASDLTERIAACLTEAMMGPAARIYGRDCTPPMSRNTTPPGGASHGLGAGAATSTASTSAAQSPVPLISALLADLTDIRGSAATGPAPTPLMSWSKVKECARAAMRTKCVTIPRFDPVRHRQLVTAILYLWTFVACGSGGVESRPLARPAASGDAKNRLVRFAIGFLYVAAETGIEMAQGVQGWPRDWWLFEHLPALQTLGHYGTQSRLTGGGASVYHATRAAAGLVSHTFWDPPHDATPGTSIDREEAGAGPTTYVRSLGPFPPGRGADSDAASDRVLAFLMPNATVATTTAASQPSRPVLRMPHRHGYQLRDVTFGKSLLIHALHTYRGDVPTRAEVAAFLRKTHSDIYDRRPKDARQTPETPVVDISPSDGGGGGGDGRHRSRWRAPVTWGLGADRLHMPRALAELSTVVAGRPDPTPVSPRRVKRRRQRSVSDVSTVTSPLPPSAFSHEPTSGPSCDVATSRRPRNMDAGSLANNGAQSPGTRGGAEPLWFCAMYVLPATGAAHLCVTDHPWNPQGPPGLAKIPPPPPLPMATSNATVASPGSWSLDTVFGAFRWHIDARVFCARWLGDGRLMTPAEYRARGRDLALAIAASPAGLRLDMWHGGGEGVDAGASHAPQPALLPPCEPSPASLFLDFDASQRRLELETRVKAARARLARASRSSSPSTPSPFVAPWVVRPTSAASPRRDSQCVVSTSMAHLWALPPAAATAPPHPPLATDSSPMARLWSFAPIADDTESLSSRSVWSPQDPMDTRG